MEQQVRFCTSADGTRIAYATYGDRTNNPVILSAIFGLYQEAIWTEPTNRAFLEVLGQDRMLITYDRRGVGGSQREVDDLSDRAEAEDLEAVADALRLERFDIVSYHIIGATFAAAHPERVHRLVLSAPYVRPNETTFLATVQQTAQVMRTNWPMARRAMASFLFPDGPAGIQRWYSNALRDGMSAETAASLMESEANSGTDYGEIFSRVIAPTLVIFPKTGSMVPFRAVQEAAATITNSRLVVLDSFLGREPATAIVTFLDEERGERPGARSNAAAADVVAILFTDIADSTALTQRLGDAKAQELVQNHNDIVRKALRQHGGTEIKHTGDGIMASFGSASAALQCSIAIQRAVVDQGDANLAVYIGVNAGEPVAEENDLFGTSVQLAKRICDAAASGEVLVSDVVRQLTAGKGFTFDERPDATLKGFDEPVRLYAVRWRD